MESVTKTGEIREKVVLNPVFCGETGVKSDLNERGPSPDWSFKCDSGDCFT